MNTDEHVFKVDEAIPRFNYSKLAYPNNTELAKGNKARTFNDAALLKLDRDIVFTDKIKALEIAPEKFDPFKYGDKAVIVGWGTTDTLALTQHLQKANLILRRDNKCLSNDAGYYKNWHLDEFSDQLLCLGGVLDGQWSYIVGQGDSGGPAICRNKEGNPVLCGITSFGGSGEKCAANYNEDNCPPSVFAEVAYFRKWIIERAGPQDPNSLYKPVLYGEKVPAGQYPHQVHITSNGGNSCGGTLIAKDVVVTAAHCIYESDESEQLRSGLEVTAGINDLVKGRGKTLRVKGAKRLIGFKREGVAVNRTTYGGRVNRMIIGDDYYSNDLAVVKLNGKAPIHTRELAILPEFDERYHEGTELAFPKDTSKSGQLTAREFRILETEECQKRMNRMAKAKLDLKVEENTLCGVEKYSGGSTCDRELGGGLICKGKGGKDVLCGVQVFRLCEFSIPNGFVNMAQFSYWVNKWMNRL